MVCVDMDAPGKANVIEINKKRWNVASFSNQGLGLITKSLFIHVLRIIASG